MNAVAVEERKKFIKVDRKPVIQDSHDAGVLKKHGEYEAEKFLNAGIIKLKLKDEQGIWSTMRKGDTRKVALASVVKEHMSVRNLWLSEQLAMGHSRSMSRLIRGGKEAMRLKT